MPFVSMCTYGHGMEGNTPLAEFQAAHQEVDIAPCPVDGIWHATVSLDGGCGYVHGRDEAELLAKLTAALGG